MGKLIGYSWYVDSIAFTPDGMGLVTGGNDHAINFWDISLDNSAGKEVWSLQEHEVRFFLLKVLV